MENGGKGEPLSRSSGTNRLTIYANLEGVSVGDSEAVHGACLTVVKTHSNLLTFDVSEETLKRSNLKYLKKGDPVNLERALLATSRLGGHILQGHVDTTLKVLLLSRSGEHWHLKIELPKEYSLFIVEKGSIGIDGISLTVNYVEEGSFSINVIPYTYENTNLKHRKVGDLVNVEFDIVGKYVINYLKHTSKDRRLEDLLTKLGFVE